MTQQLDPAGASPEPTDFTELDAILSQHLAKALDMVPLDENTNVRVIMPRPEELAVRLVPVHWIHRLFEADTDHQRAVSIMWAAIGALLGLITNAIFALEMPNAAVLVFTGLLLATSIGSGVLAHFLARRADRVRAELNGGQS